MAAPFLSIELSIIITKIKNFKLIPSNITSTKIMKSLISWMELKRGMAGA